MLLNAGLALGLQYVGLALFNEGLMLVLVDIVLGSFTLGSQRGHGELRI